MSISSRSLVSSTVKAIFAAATVFLPIVVCSFDVPASRAARSLWSFRAASASRPVASSTITFSRELAGEPSSTFWQYCPTRPFAMLKTKSAMIVLLSHILGKEKLLGPFHYEPHPAGSAASLHWKFGSPEQQSASGYP